MPLDWRPAGGAAIASSLHGFDRDRFLVAQVVKYDVPPGWRAFSRGYPVSDAWWPDMFAAMREAERFLEAAGKRQKPADP